ncbi:MAG: hypothetical protein HY719_01295 [Planctomycetes bacterium]|nr:hypothetical protein [Planctomycetota bacterium]
MAAKRRTIDDLIRLDREAHAAEYAALTREGQAGVNGGGNPNEYLSRSKKIAAAAVPSVATKNILYRGGGDDETRPGGVARTSQPAAPGANAGSETCPTCGGGGTLAAKTTFPSTEEAIASRAEQTTARTRESETEPATGTTPGRAFTREDFIDAFGRLQGFFGRLRYGVESGVIRVTANDGRTLVDIPGMFAFPEAGGPPEGGGGGNGKPQPPAQPAAANDVSLRDAPVLPASDPFWKANDTVKHIGDLVSIEEKNRVAIGKKGILFGTKPDCPNGSDAIQWIHQEAHYSDKNGALRKHLFTDVVEGFNRTFQTTDSSVDQHSINVVSYLGPIIAHPDGVAGEVSIRTEFVICCGKYNDPSKPVAGARGEVEYFRKNHNATLRKAMTVEEQAKPNVTSEVNAALQKIECVGRGLHWGYVVKVDPATLKFTAKSTGETSPFNVSGTFTR